MSNDDPQYVTKEVCEVKMKRLEDKIDNIKQTIVLAVSISTAFLSIIMYLLR